MAINIENYLKKKKAQLDVENPDEMMLWEGIRKEIITESKEPRFNFWKIAAVFLAIFTFTYVLYNELRKEKEFTLSQINETLGDREEEYRNLVLLKKKAANIDQISSDQESEILLELFNELDELDTIYLNAMNDLKQHGYLERIVEIIFDTYEKRIHILEQIIMESQKQKINENDAQNIRL